MVGELAAIGAAFSWAVAFMVIRSAPPAVPPMHLNAVRLLAPAVMFPAALFLLGWRERFLEMTWQNFAALTASVVAGIGVGDVLLFKAMRAVGVVRAYTIGGTFPLFGVFYAALLLGEDVGPFAVLGTVLIVGGGAFVSARSRKEVAAPTTRSADYRRGLALCVLVAAMWGSDMVFLKIGLGQAHPVVANSFRMPLAAIVITVLAWRNTGAFPILNTRPRVAALLLASGALGLGIGSGLNLAAFQLIGAARAGAIGAVSPVFAMLLALIFFNERPGWAARVGTVMAAAGVAFLSIS